MPTNNLRLSYDVETTGLPDFTKPSDAPGQPRICQLAMALFNPAGEIQAHYEGLVFPDGWEIPDAVVAIHGITTETCRKLGKPIKEVLANFQAMALKGAELVGYNPFFDDKMIRGEMFRAGMRIRNEPYVLDAIPTVNLQPPATALCKLAPTDAMMASGRKSSKTAKLGEATQVLLKRKLDRAHDAMADVRAVVDLWVYLANVGKLPISKVFQPKGSAPQAISGARVPLVGPITGGGLTEF